MVLDKTMVVKNNKTKVGSGESVVDREVLLVVSTSSVATIHEKTQPMYRVGSAQQPSIPVQVRKTPNPASPLKPKILTPPLKSTFYKKEV
ncbi:MAG: hypothetical protein ACOYWZ_20090 [Bacillota bacterium]